MALVPSFLCKKKTADGVNQIGLGFGFAIGWRFPLSRCSEGIPPTDIRYWVWADKSQIDSYVGYQVRILWFFVGRLIKNKG